MKKKWNVWTTFDLKLLAMGIRPIKHSMRACYIFCKRNAVPFPGIRTLNENEYIIKKFDNKTNQGKGSEMKQKKIDTNNRTVRPEMSANDVDSYTFETVATDKVVMSGNIREDHGGKSLDELAASIRAHGIINPVTVVKTPKGYSLVAGFRRLAAARKAGLKEIPCHVVKGDSHALTEMALTENISRLDMTPYEECVCVGRLSDSNHSARAIAKRFGRTVRWVAVRKKLADAGEDILQMVKNGKVRMGAAAMLVELPDDVFAKEVADCWQLDELAAENILARVTHDVRKAPFDHEACLACHKCSACQIDLLDNDPTALCLDTECWKRKCRAEAERRVEAYTAEGRKATLDADEYDDYGIGTWNTSDIKKAEEAGVEKRVFVNSSDLSEKEYFDKRDLPDYREETEEEQEERIRNGRIDREIERKRDRIWKEDMKAGITEAVQHGSPILMVALLALVPHDNGEAFDEDSVSMLTGVEKDSADFTAYITAEDVAEDTSAAMIARAAVNSVPSLLDTVYSIGDIKALYRIFTGLDPDGVRPTEEDARRAVEAESENGSEESPDNDNE